MKTLRYSVDRIENETAILMPDEGKAKLELSLSVYGFKPNMLLDITFDGNEIKEIKELPEKTAERLERNRSRLHSLFTKNKK